MQELGGRYVRVINRIHARTGTLWEARFRSSLVDSENYLLVCQRYIELNPVRAGLVRLPDEYRWSSYDAHAFGTDDDLVTPHHVFEALAPTPDERQRAWRTICQSALSEDQLATMRASPRRVHATTRAASTDRRHQP